MSTITVGFGNTLLLVFTVDARYNTSYAVSKEELEILAGWVRELRDRVKRVCRERIRGLGEGRA